MTAEGGSRTGLASKFGMLRNGGVAGRPTMFGSRKIVSVSKYATKSSK
jgi:hypothetical protein